MSFSFLKIHKIVLAIIGLTLFGFILRFALEPKVPMGFYRDEAGILYSAYSILMTGRDQWGAYMPLHFKALGDYPPGIYNYLTALSIVLFGYGDLAERMPSIVFGTLLIPLSYYFLKKVFDNEKLGFVVASLVCISPWEVIQSRSGSEPIVALVFTLIALLLFRYWIMVKDKKKILAILGMLLMYFLATFTYNAARMILPLLHVVFMWYWWPKKGNIRESIMNVFILFIVGIFCVGVVFITQSSALRFTSISIQNIDTATTQLVYHTREYAQRIPNTITQTIHNRPWLLIDVFVQNYFSHFSPGFLFFQGGYPLRYRIPETGVLPYFLLVFVFVIPFSRGQLTKKQWILVLLFLFLSPLPSAITKEDIPHVKRSLYMYLPLYTIFGASILQLWEMVSKKKIAKYLFIGFMLIAISWTQIQFFTNYLVHSKYSTIDDRSYGYEEVFAYLKENHTNDSIVIYENFDTPYIFYLAYNKYDPKKFQSIASTVPINLFSEMENKRLWKLENITFTPGSCIQKDDLIEDTIYVTKGECIDSPDIFSEVVLLHSVINPDGFKKFVLFKKI